MAGVPVSRDHIVVHKPLTGGRLRTSPAVSWFVGAAMRRCYGMAAGRSATRASSWKTSCRRRIPQPNNHGLRYPRLSNLFREREVEGERPLMGLYLSVGFDLQVSQMYRRMRLRILPDGHWYRKANNLVTRFGKVLNGRRDEFIGLSNGIASRQTVFGKVRMRHHVRRGIPTDAGGVLLARHGRGIYAGTLT